MDWRGQEKKQEAPLVRYYSGPGRGHSGVDQGGRGRDQEKETETT